MTTAIISIIAAVIAATMSGIGIWQADKANKQNQQLAIENREDQQAFSTAAAQAANQASEHRYWNLYSPSSTVNQLKAAGLSPGLFYSQGGSSGQNVSAAQAATPSSAPAVVNPIIPGDMFSQIFDSTDWNEVRKTDSDIKVNESTIKINNKTIEQMDHKINEIDANIQKIEAETNTEIVRKRGEELKNDLAELEKEYQSASLQDRIQMNKKQLDVMQASYEKTLEEIKGLEIDNKYKEELYTETLKKMRAETAKLVAERLNVIEDTYLKEAQERLANMQTLLTDTERRKGEKQIKKLDWEIKDLSQKCQKQAAELDYIDEVGYGWASQDWKGRASEGWRIGIQGITDDYDSFCDGFWNFIDWIEEKGKQYEGWAASGGH